MIRSKSAQAKTTTRREEAALKAKKNGHAGAVPPLAWSATEYVPRKRWWWFVTFGYITLSIMFLLLAAGNWSAGLLTGVLGVAVMVMYLAKPRVWNYQLTPKTLTAEARGKRLSWPLEQFRAFTVEEIPQGKKHEPYVLIVLYPEGRFKPSRDVYLTDDVEYNYKIAEALDQVIPYEDVPGGSLSARILDRLARTLRLG
jgi:hypothetical protein